MGICSTRQHHNEGWRWSRNLNFVASWQSQVLKSISLNNLFMLSVLLTMLNRMPLVNSRLFDNRRHIAMGQSNSNIEEEAGRKMVILARNQELEL